MLKPFLHITIFLDDQRRYRLRYVARFHAFWATESGPTLSGVLKQPRMDHFTDGPGATAVNLQSCYTHLTHLARAD